MSTTFGNQLDGLMFFLLFYSLHSVLLQLYSPIFSRTFCPTVPPSLLGLCLHRVQSLFQSCIDHLTCKHSTFFLLSISAAEFHLWPWSDAGTLQESRIWPLWCYAFYVRKLTWMQYDHLLVFLGSCRRQVPKWSLHVEKDALSFLPLLNIICFALS